MSVWWAFLLNRVTIRSSRNILGSIKIDVAQWHFQEDIFFPFRTNFCIHVMGKQLHRVSVDTCCNIMSFLIPFKALSPNYFVLLNRKGCPLELMDEVEILPTKISPLELCQWLALKTGLWGKILQASSIESYSGKCVTQEAIIHVCLIDKLSFLWHLENSDTLQKTFV